MVWHTPTHTTLRKVKMRDGSDDHVRHSVRGQTMWLFALTPIRVLQYRGGGEQHEQGARWQLCGHRCDIKLHILQSVH